MGRRPKRETDPARRRALDIAFEPLPNFGGKGKKTALSLHEILLRQTFKAALDGESKGARTMLKMAREFAARIRLRSRLRLQSVGSAALRVNQERHLIDRQTCKLRRSAALAERQNLMA